MCVELARLLVSRSQRPFTLARIRLARFLSLIGDVLRNAKMERGKGMAKRGLDTRDYTNARTNTTHVNAFGS